MVVVLVLVVLVVIGGAAAFLMKSKQGSTSAGPVSGASGSPVTGTVTNASPPETSTRQQVAPVGHPTGRAAEEPDEVEDEEVEDEEVGEVVDRFKAPGQRTASKSTYRPTTPRKPVHLLEAPVSAAGPEPSSEPADDSKDMVTTTPPSSPASEPRIEAEADADAEADTDVDPEARGEVVVEGDAAADVVIDLGSAPVDTEPTPESADTATADEALVEIEPEITPQQGLDEVLRSLISRAHFTQREVADVAAELVDRAELDPSGVAEVLADLVEVAEVEEDLPPSEPVEELLLFSEEVPRRPGQMTDFAELNERERRRVIIRVLCLLVARNEEQRSAPAEPVSEAETPAWPVSRAVWPAPAPDEDDDVDLPARRRLARARH